MIPLKLLVCFVTFWHLSQASKNALFFDWQDETIVQIDKFDDEDVTKCQSCISACPTASNSDKEVLINDKASVTGNSIFMRDVYPEPIYANEMQIEICDKPIIPSLVWNENLDTFEVGYEMFYEEGHGIKLISTQYDKLVKVVDGNPSLAPREPSRADKMKIHKTSENTTFEVIAQPEKKLIFYWINVLSFDIFDEHHVRVASLTDDAINDSDHRVRTISSCQSYFSGDGTKTVDKEEETKETQVLEKVPQEVDGQSNDDEEIADESKNTSDRLVKAQILPMDMFHTLYARLATCMYLNFTFVWQAIADSQLKKVDSYLYGLYRTYPDEVVLSFGVSGNLRGIDQAARKAIKSEHHLFTKYPVPEMIYRFVDVTINGKAHGAVVVIHNDVKPVQHSDRICPVEEELESWKRIKNTNYKTGFCYACAQTPQVLKKLGFDEKTASVDMVPLKLDSFPHLPDPDGPIEYKSALGKIDHTIVISGMKSNVEAEKN